MQPLQYSEGVVEPALGAAAGPGRWFVGFAALLVCADFQRRRQHSAITAHRAVPVCELPALGTLWSTVMSNAASAVCSRCDGTCTGGCGRAGQVVVLGGLVLPVCVDFHTKMLCSGTTAHRALPVCE